VVANERRYGEAISEEITCGEAARKTTSMNGADGNDDARWLPSRQNLLAAAGIGDQSVAWR